MDMNMDTTSSMDMTQIACQWKTFQEMMDLTHSKYTWLAACNRAIEMFQNIFFQKCPTPELSRFSLPVRPEPVWATDSYFPSPSPPGVMVTGDPRGAVLFQVPPR